MKYKLPIFSIVAILIVYLYSNYESVFKMTFGDISEINYAYFADEEMQSDELFILASIYFISSNPDHMRIPKDIYMYIVDHIESNPPKNRTLRNKLLFDKLFYCYKSETFEDENYNRSVHERMKKEYFE